MGVWAMQVKEEDVTLTYDELDGTPIQSCGRGPVKLLKPLLEWLVDQAEPGELLALPSGLFFKQAEAKGWRS